MPIVYKRRTTLLGGPFCLGNQPGYFNEASLRRTLER
jgi:hypothetical protein